MSYSCQQDTTLVFLVFLKQNTIVILSNVSCVANIKLKFETGTIMLNG